jgi:hypothetical protein
VTRPAISHHDLAPTGRGRTFLVRCRRPMMVYPGVRNR